jgi:hypothetical protein
MRASWGAMFPQKRISRGDEDHFLKKYRRADDAGQFRWNSRFEESDDEYRHSNQHQKQDDL